MHGRAVVCVARSNERVYNFVGREMLQGGIAALAHPIFTAAETLQLIRDILAQQLATSPGPRQVRLHVHNSLHTLLSVYLCDAVGVTHLHQRRKLPCSTVNLPVHSIMQLYLPCTPCTAISCTLNRKVHSMQCVLCRHYWLCLPSHHPC